jgi:hypothetical protein
VHSGICFRTNPIDFLRHPNRAFRGRVTTKVRSGSPRLNASPLSLTQKLRPRAVLKSRFPFSRGVTARGNSPGFRPPAMRFAAAPTCWALAFHVRRSQVHDLQSVSPAAGARQWWIRNARAAAVSEKQAPLRGRHPSRLPGSYQSDRGLLERGIRRYSLAAARPALRC